MYAQTHYPQELGNGKYTIAQAGCLLTSIANGLERLNGSAPDPVTLNEFYKSRGLFIRDPDGANEDLAWGSITQYDPNIVLEHVGSGSLPPSPNAIVKFHYIGLHTGSPIDHYCWVDHIDNGQVWIIDSYDGQVKPPSGYLNVYHQPIAWATYVKHVPAPTPPPAPAPPAPAAVPYKPPQGAYTVPSGEKYLLVVSVPGFLSSSQAAKHSGASSPVPAGNYAVFNKYNGMINISRVAGQPGWWINPGDNVAPPPEPTPQTQTELYRVLIEIPGYNTSNDAANHINKKETMADGAYFVFNRAHNMINISKQSTVPGAWINPTDNIPPAPAPTPPPAPVSVPAVDWRSTYKPFPAPVSYIAMVPGLHVTDLEEKRNDQPWDIHRAAELSGTVEKDGITYGRLTFFADKYLWMCVSLAVNGVQQNLVEPENVVFNVKKNLADRQATKTVTPQDRAKLILFGLEKFGEDVVRLAKRKK